MERSKTGVFILWRPSYLGMRERPFVPAWNDLMHGRRDGWHNHGLVFFALSRYVLLAQKNIMQLPFLL